MLDHLEALLSGIPEPVYPAVGMFRLDYNCPKCGTSWSDEWSCLVDDECPKCGETCSPVAWEDM